MRRILIFAGGIAAFLVQLSTAHAQHLIVQEPTLETFGVGTTVSVPDRGRRFVAGSGSSAASRSSYGPFRSGTNIGLSQQASGLSVGVYVHDMAEMDRHILAGAERSRERTVLPKDAERAYETLRVGVAGGTVTNGAQSATVAAATRRALPGVPPDAGPSAERLLDRARQAESTGKRELALAYLRTARNMGSPEARQEIARLSR
jgi:hypothetical protein